MLVTRVCAFLAGSGSFALAMPAFAQEIGQRIEQPVEQTRILSTTDVERLRTFQGMTLQWLDWDERGPASVIFAKDGTVILEGSQFDDTGAGVRVSGVITEIGKDYFLLDGRIQIIGTPDADRRCDADKVWRFAATQRRAYYRLREFEWCDYLTDYVDFYFAPGLR